MRDYGLCRGFKKRSSISFVFKWWPRFRPRWLHMGLLGPKDSQWCPVDAQDRVNALNTLIDNANSPLDKTDLVFIDPIGTA